MVGNRVLATLIASTVLTSSVLAQPAKPPTEKEKQKASEIVKRAITKAQANEHEAAIELYLEAYAIAALPTLLSNVAHEYQQAGNPAEATKYFCMYLDKDPTGPLVTYAISQLQSLRLGPPVDDRELCKPQATTTTSDSATGNKTDSDPNAVAGTDLAPTTETMPPALDPGMKLKLAGMIAGGAGVVGLGFGITFGIAAKNISDDIEHRTTGWYDGVQKDQARGERDEKLQITFLVLGGALITGGTIMYLVGRSRTSKSESLTLAPTATHTSAGLALSGSF